MLRSLKMIKFLHRANNLLSLEKSSEIGQNVCCNFFWSQANVRLNNTISSITIDEDENKRPKTVRIPKITLILPDESVIITELTDAEKLAKRRNLILDKLNYDYKSNREVYKLCKNTDYTSPKDEKPIKEKSMLKGQKLFFITCKINYHDLDIKINNINKLLEKKHEVKLILTLRGDKEEKSFQRIKKNIKGNLLQEKFKGKTVNLLYAPLLSNEIDNSEKNDDSDNIKLKET
ncbi:translation initiation factor IF-3-like [Colletes gigas]|uniref:translation initiation factor IF-3-like n=1 Tax=Colletes gigas TaxID=935657 RepID=UPI001C9B1AB9|nr:translation initiation factor IF-3-like [Colletes gigas]